MMLSGVLCCKQLVRRFLLQIMHIVLSPQSPLSVWPAWHKQCHISDRHVLSRITRGREGGGLGGAPACGAQSEGLTDGKWGSLSLILRQADVPSPCVAGCWPGESQAAAEMKKLESSSGGELVIWCPAQEQSVTLNELRERGSLCSLLQRPILMAKAGENLKQKPPSSFLICVVRENSSSQDVWLQNKALHITTGVIYHLFIFLITQGTKEEWQWHKSVTWVSLKRVKLHSHKGAATSFLPGTDWVLQAKEALWRLQRAWDERKPCLQRDQPCRSASAAAL